MPNLKPEQFIAKAFTDPQLDLAEHYKDENFRHALRIYALEVIYTTLYPINKRQTKYISTLQTVRATKALNEPNLATGLTIMDYCLIAGLADLASKFMTIECSIALPRDQFKQRLKNIFKDAPPTIVTGIMVIFEQLAEMEKRKNEASALVAANKKRNHSNMHKLKTFVVGEYRNATALALFGLLCFFASPMLFTMLALKASGIVIGLSSMFASGALVQAIDNHKNEQAALLASRQMYEETKNIWGAVDMTKKQLVFYKKVDQVKSHVKEHHYVDNRNEDMFYLPGLKLTKQPAAKKGEKPSFELVVPKKLVKV